MGGELRAIDGPLGRRLREGDKEVYDREIAVRSSERLRNEPVLDAARQGQDDAEGAHQVTVHSTRSDLRVPAGAAYTTRTATYRRSVACSA